MLLFQPDQSEALEWGIARRVVAESAAREPEKWTALAVCPIVEAYTDGSAPVRNPGGPAGFCAVLVGFEETLAYENGRLAAFEGEAVALVQLRGRGGVVIAAKGSLITTEVKADHNAVVARDQTALPRPAQGPPPLVRSPSTGRVGPDSSGVPGPGEGHRHRHQSQWRHIHHS